MGAAGRRNLTEGPITSTLLMFSLPLLGGNLLQSLNAAVNQFWVSHTRALGVSAISALSNANIVMMMMLGAIFGVSMAANILVAQAIGADDVKTAKKVMGTSITFFFVMSCVVAVLGWLLTPAILTLMGTPAVSKAEAIIYLRIIFAAMPFQYFFLFMQMAQRGAGDSRTPFYFMALAIVLDIILNPLLIRGIGPFPKLGIAGSATSTLIGQGVSLTFLIVYLYRKHSILLLRLNELHLLKPDFRILKALVLRGVPMGFQMFVMSGAAMVMIGFVNSFGAVTTAAYASASQVWTFIQMPGMAVGASVSSMAAQNVGAGRWDRVAKIARSGLLSSVAVTGTIAVAIYAMGPLPLYIFLPADSPAVPIALHINRMVLWAFVLFNATFALSGVVRSTGAVLAPLVILIISMWVIRVPFAWALIPHFGAEAIWWSFPLGTITSSVLTALYYRFGDWRKSRMLGDEPRGQTPDAGMAPPAMDPPEADEDAAAAVAASKAR